MFYIYHEHHHSLRNSGMPFIAVDFHRKIEESSAACLAGMDEGTQYGIGGVECIVQVDLMLQLSQLTLTLYFLAKK